MTLQLNANGSGVSSPWARPTDDLSGSGGFTAPTFPPRPPIPEFESPPAPPIQPPSPPPIDPRTDDDGHQRDRSRAGAVWVTGMGAFLIVAAAAVFVAVQWDQIRPEIKLAILAALTGGFLLAGRRLRSILPATSGVLFHLGAFLIPINVAAIALHQQADWPAFLLVEGAAAAVSWWILDRVEQSVVLRAATVAAVVFTAAGFGAVTHLPPALVLVGCAVMAEGLRRHRTAVAWALVAGLAPALALATPALPLGIREVIEAMGLAGPAPQILAAVSGILAAAVLGRDAHRRRDLVTVVLAAVVVMLGIGTAVTGARTGTEVNLVGAGVLFLLIEVTAHLVRRDPFWGVPGRVAGLIAEGLAAAATPVAMLCAAWIVARPRWTAFSSVPWMTSRPGWSALVAGVLFAASWFIADLRRRQGHGGGLGIAMLVGGGFAPTTVLASLALLSGVAASTASLPAVALASVAVAGLLVLSGRPWGHAVAVCLVLPAVVLNGSDRWITGAVALTGAIVLASAAVIRARMNDRDVNAPLAWATAIAAVLAVELGWVAVVGQMDSLALLILVAVGCLLVGLICDRAGAIADVQFLGIVGRMAAVFTLVQAIGRPPSEIAILAGVLSATAILDALLRANPNPLFALPVTVPVAVAACAAANGYRLSYVGVVLCVVAAVAAGWQLILPREWGAPVLGVMLTSGIAGFMSAAADLSTASTALIMLAGIGLSYSIVFHSSEGAAFCGFMATIGVWGHLAAAQSSAIDAYVAPVAAGLLIAGIRSRRGKPIVSSWVAYAPAIILLGGSAMYERLQGGHGVHALIAGAVGIAAILAGGGRRLAAPLFLGTALLVALTGHESLAVTRQVPTWGWMALGGAVLVAAGIIMERLDTGPLESGKRLVDEVSRRFT